EMPHNWLKEQADYYEEVLTDYQAKYSRLQELKKKMRCQNNRVQPKDGCKQNCLVQIPGSSKKKELVKNDIIYLPLNTLPD
ncbi:1897_t:CDS:2, partial [Dentiscutata heterogama]